MRPAAAASARARAPCLSFQWLAYARPCNWPAPRQAVLRVRLCSCAGPSAAGLPLKTQHPVGSCVMLFQVKCGPILDRREPHLHAPSSSMVRLPHICTTPTTLHLPASHPASHPASRPAPYQYPAPHSHCTTWTSFCTMPCTMPCTTLHHTRLHHARPAPHPGACSAPCTTLALVLHQTAPHSPAPHSPAPHLPAPHPPCTTLACTTSTMHHKVESHKPGSDATNLTPHCTIPVCTTIAPHHICEPHSCTTLLHSPCTKLTLHLPRTTPCTTLTLHRTLASQSEQIAHHSVEEMLQVHPNPNPNRRTPHPAILVSQVLSQVRVL